MTRILLADDDPTQLALRRMLLEASGYEISSAPTAADAIRQLASFQPEVLVTDLRLPSLEDGLELIRIAAQQGRRPRVIVFSGCPGDLVGQPEERLVARVIPKPSRTEVLLRAIRELTAVLCLLLLAGAGQAGAARRDLRAGGTLASVPARFHRPGDSLLHQSSGLEIPAGIMRSFSVSGARSSGL
jgi:CheY-like chemotaxis protein